MHLTSGIIDLKIPCLSVRRADRRRGADEGGWLDGLAGERMGGWAGGRASGRTSGRAVQTGGRRAGERANGYHIAHP